MFFKKLYMSHKRFLVNVSFFSSKTTFQFEMKNAYHTNPVYENCMIRVFSIKKIKKMLKTIFKNF